MTILAVDGCPGRLEALARCLQEVFPEDEIKAFSDPGLAVQHSFRAEVTATFVGPCNRRLDSLAVVQGIQFFHPGARAFLITDQDTPKRMLDRAEISAYLHGPVTAGAIRTAVFQSPNDFEDIKV